MSSLSRMATIAHFLAVCFALILICTRPSTACTTVHATVNPYSNSPDANVTVIGRTMELGFRALLPIWDIVVVPRRSPKFHNFFTLFTDGTLDNAPYDPYKTLNAIGFVAINIPVTVFREPIGPANVPLEGQNEYGLTMSAQILQISRYQTLDPSDSLQGGKAGSGSTKYQLAWLDVIPYLLGSFTNAEDAIHALRTEVVVTRPGLFNEAYGLGLHWTLDDANGVHYVIEYLDNQLVVHRTKVGVLTNDPAYSWQVTNLDNYANVQANIPTVPQDIQVKQPTNLFPQPIETFVPHPVSHGTGLLGLPGDSSPAGRFVRMFFLRRLAHANAAPADLKEALALVTNLLDAVAIPFGTVGPVCKTGTRSVDDNGQCADASLHDFEPPSLHNLLTDVELQQWGVLKVPSRGLFYYRDYVNSAWKLINFAYLDFSEGAPIKTTKVHIPSEPFAAPSPLKVQD